MVRAPGNVSGPGNSLGQLMNKSKFFQDATSYGGGEGHNGHRLNNHQTSMVNDDLIKSSSEGSDGYSENECELIGGGRRKKLGQGSSSSQYASL